MSGISTNQMPLVASTKLSDKAHYFGKISAALTIALNDSAANAYCVIQPNDCDGVTTQNCPYITEGPTKIVLGGTLAAGAKIKSHTDGTAVAASAGDITSGTLLEGGVAGNKVWMDMHKELLHS